MIRNKACKGLSGAVAAGTIVVALGGATPALAGGSSTYNDVNVNITGGNARVLTGCINYARVLIRHGLDPQKNVCADFATAIGGDVTLKHVSVAIAQVGSGYGRTTNNATVNISGGDATVVAACVNYLQGTSTPNQQNDCGNGTLAAGGNVSLKDVDITVLQSA